MSITTNMKTGINPARHHETIFPETFFIIYLILGAILRRCGFKDAIVYSEHNGFHIYHYEDIKSIEEIIRNTVYKNNY